MTTGPTLSYDDRLQAIEDRVARLVEQVAECLRSRSGESPRESQDDEGIGAHEYLLQKAEAGLEAVHRAGASLRSIAAIVRPPADVEDDAEQTSDEIGDIDCRCSFASVLRPSVHGRLIEWDQRDLDDDGMTGFVEQIRDSLVLGGTPGEMLWMDLPDFVAQHNWADPAGTLHLAQSIDGVIREAMRRGPLPKA